MPKKDKSMLKKENRVIYYEDRLKGIRVYKENVYLGEVVGLGNPFYIEIEKKNPSLLEKLLKKESVKILVGFDFWRQEQPVYKEIHREIKKIKVNYPHLIITFEKKVVPFNSKYTEVEHFDLSKYLPYPSSNSNTNGPNSKMNFFYMPQTGKNAKNRSRSSNN